MPKTSPNWYKTISAFANASFVKIGLRSRSTKILPARVVVFLKGVLCLQRVSIALKYFLNL